MKIDLLILFFIASTNCSPLGDKNRIYRSFKGILELEWNRSSLEYSIRRDNETWLESGPFFLHFNDKFYSSSIENETIPMEQLFLIDQSETTGIDVVLGPFDKLSLSWSISPSGNATVWETSFKIFQEKSLILFEQYFPQNLDGMSMGNVRDTFKQVSTGFPRFRVSFNETDRFVIDQLGHLTFLDCWDLKMRGVGLKNVFNGGLYSGNPLVLFNRTKIDSNLVLSSFNNFMTNFQTRSPTLNFDLTCGLQGRVRQIEQSFTLKTILLGSEENEGINQVLRHWGEILLSSYGKKHPKDEEDFLSDFFISKLGYYTDTGAYYWYNTEPNSTYEKTMIDLRNYHRSAKIPIGYYELDSYWYYKQNNNTGEHGGIKFYEPRPDVFPSGIKNLQKTVFQTPLIVHHKYYSTDNIYQTFYKFVNGSDGKVSLPVDQRFFNKIFSQIKSWGVEILIQDWLSSIYEDMPEASYDVETARQYHLHLSGAAKQSNIKIIYCMPLNPDILETIENDQVKYIRISDDYSTNVNQWNIGRASIVTWSIGVLPFKDTFWTNSFQPNSPYGNFTEPNVELNGIVALLSLAGVSISDKIFNTNVELVGRLCRTDGFLLRPSRPATSIDATFLAENEDLGEILHTFSTDDQQTIFYEIFLVTNLTRNFTFSWQNFLQTDDRHFPQRKFSQFYLVFDRNQPQQVQWFSPNRSETESFLFPSCPQNLTTFFSPFHLFVFIPLDENSKWIVLGETEKFLPVSRQRFQSISTGDSLRVQIFGVNGENVTISVAFIPNLFGSIEIFQVSCLFDPNAQPLTTMNIFCSETVPCHCDA